MENKKIKNATETVYNNITFKSKLEYSFYKTLHEAGFDVQYEPLKYVIVKGFSPKVPFWNRSKSRVFRCDMSKVRDITYTPDFIIKGTECLYIIEAKGIENDTYPIKKKLFRKYLEDNNIKAMYFEVHTKKELLQVIDIIKENEKES